MKSKVLQFALVLVVGCGTFFIGNKIYFYFTHNQKPHITLEGLADKQHCKGELACAITSKNSYAISSVQAFLDEQPITLSVDKNLGKKRINIPVTIDTTTLNDGKHVLSVQAVDSSYQQNSIKKDWEFFVDNTPLKAAFLEEEYSVAQGKTLHIKVKTNKPIHQIDISYSNQKYQAYQQSPTSNIYECFIPIECEQAAGDSTLLANVADAAGNTASLSNKVVIQKFKFKRQVREYNIQQKLDQEKDVSLNHKILESAIKKWSDNSSSEKLWKGAFEIPTKVQTLLTPHGEIRITPERGRYMHKGIDIANLPRSVVWAAQDGKVVIKDRFLITGNTIVIDHGRGVSTIYAHLEDFADIEVGDALKKGNPIGKIGKTGYAQGYHLHWELRVNGIAVDPLEWTKKIY